MLPRTCHQVRNRSQHILPCLHAPDIKSETAHSIFLPCLHALDMKPETAHSMFCLASTHLTSSQKPLTAYSVMPPRTCHQVRNRSQHIRPCLHAPDIKSETAHSIFCHAFTHLTSNQKPLTACSALPPCTYHQIRNRRQHILPCLNAPDIISETAHSIFCHAFTHLTSNQEPPTAYSAMPPRT